MHGDAPTNAIPNPGTVAAQMRGCKCPVIDNGHGRGWRGQPDVFVYTVGCPIHCPGEEPTFDTPARQDHTVAQESEG